MSDPTPPRYLVELQPLATSSTPPEVRLRGLLRVALRRFALRAVRVEPVDPPAPADEPKEAPPCR